MQNILKGLTLFLVGLTAANAADHRANGSGTTPYQLWKRQTAHALELRGDAKSLATAALLLLGSGATDSKGAMHPLELANEAAEREPDDRAIGWIRLRICEMTPECDIQGAATTVRWLDADNAAAWLPSLQKALKDRNEREVDRALAGMAQGKRFYFYWNPAVVLIFDAVRSAPAVMPSGFLDSDHRRLADAVGLSSASLIPPLHPLTDACRDPGSSQRRESCLRVSVLTQQADTITLQMVGLAMQKRLFAGDSKEAHTAAEHRKSLEWRSLETAKFETAFLPWSKNRVALHRIALMREFPREEDAVNATLREHHLNPESASRSHL